MIEHLYYGRWIVFLRCSYIWLWCLCVEPAQCVLCPQSCYFHTASEYLCRLVHVHTVTSHVKMQRNLLNHNATDHFHRIECNVILLYIWVVNFKICIIAAPLYLCYILFSCLFRSSLGEYTIINNKKELASKPAIKAVCPWNNNIFCSFLLIFTYIL